MDVSFSFLKFSGNLITSGDASKMKPSDYDDGGCFDRLVKEAEEAANGDKKLKEHLLAYRVIRDIEEYVRAKARHAARPPNVLNLYVPKRTRTGVCSSGGGGGSSQDKKRWFEQMMIETETKTNDNIVQEEEPAEKKMKKSNKKKRRIIKIIKKANINNARVIPEIPERFKNKIEEMGGSRIELVIQKEITHCDTTVQHNRLAIPPKQMINNKFLEPDEYERVVQRKEPMKNVKLIEPCLSRVTEVTLKRWDMEGNFTLNLIKTWHTEVSTNGSNRLHVGAPVQLYSFRRVENDNELCFALVNLDLEA